MQEYQEKEVLLHNRYQLASTVYSSTSNENQSWNY